MSRRRLTSREEGHGGAGSDVSVFCCECFGRLGVQVISEECHGQTQQKKSHLVENVKFPQSQRINCEKHSSLEIETPHLGALVWLLCCSSGICVVVGNDEAKKMPTWSVATPWSSSLVVGLDRVFMLFFKWSVWEVAGECIMSGFTQTVSHSLVLKVLTPPGLWVGLTDFQPRCATRCSTFVFLSGFQIGSHTLEIIALKAFGGCFRLRVYFSTAPVDLIEKTIGKGISAIWLILDSQHCFGPWIDI